MSNSFLWDILTVIFTCLIVFMGYFDCDIYKSKLNIIIVNINRCDMVSIIKEIVNGSFDEKTINNLLTIKFNQTENVTYTITFHWRECKIISNIERKQICTSNNLCSICWEHGRLLGDCCGKIETTINIYGVAIADEYITIRNYPIGVLHSIDVNQITKVSYDKSILKFLKRMFDIELPLEIYAIIFEYLT